VWTCEFSERTSREIGSIGDPRSSDTLTMRLRSDEVAGRDHFWNEVFHHPLLPDQVMLLRRIWQRVVHHLVCRGRQVASLSIRRDGRVDEVMHPG